jgi:hypothetical protein
MPMDHSTAALMHSCFNPSIEQGSASLPDTPVLLRRRVITVIRSVHKFIVRSEVVLKVTSITC